MKNNYSEQHIKYNNIIQYLNLVIQGIFKKNHSFNIRKLHVIKTKYNHLWESLHLKDPVWLLLWPILFEAERAVHIFHHDGQIWL